MLIAGTIANTLILMTAQFLSAGPGGLGVESRPAATSPPAKDPSHVKFEVVNLEGGEAPAKIHLAYRPRVVERHPVILMLGSLKPGELPYWSPDLVDEGYMLAAFSVAHPPDPDPARRPQWLFFDQRFAHSYVLGGYRAPLDAGRVIDHLLTRGDINAEKIGWMGASSTGIPGLAAATREKRLAAVVVFVSTGAYRQWLETWHTNGLWRGTSKELWPETVDLLKYDPILHVDKLFPTAILMVNGGEDKVVDPRTARAFAEAARPHYVKDPDRFRLVVYEGCSHNLPSDIVKMYTEHWFHRYMHPTRLPPSLPASQAGNLEQSVKQTQINASDHRDVIGASNKER